MIPGHIYLSAVIPPSDRLPEAGVLVIAAVVLSYLMVKGLIYYAEWREHHKTEEVTHDI
jgi:hypothetical protein